MNDLEVRFWQVHCSTWVQWSSSFWDYSSPWLSTAGGQFVWHVRESTAINDRKRTLLSQNSSAERNITNPGFLSSDVNLSSNTIDLSMIIANAVRNEWDWNCESTRRARSELTR